MCIRGGSGERRMKDTLILSRGLQERSSVKISQKRNRANCKIFCEGYLGNEKPPLVTLNCLFLQRGSFITVEKYGQSPFFVPSTFCSPAFSLGETTALGESRSNVGKLLTQEKCLLDGQDIGKYGGGCFITNIVILGKTGFLVIIY